jgi:hypothetical protein
MATYTVRAPDGSTVTIQGPEGASQEEIIAKAQELMASRGGAQTRQQRTAPTSFMEYLRTQPLLEPFTRQAIRGAVVDPINALRQLTTEGQREAVAREEAAYQAEREALGETGYEFGRLAGNILSPASLGVGAAAVRGVGGVGRMARVRQAAGAGAAGAVLQPVLEEDVDFATEKVKQLGLGAVTGSLLEGGIQGVQGGVKFISDFVQPLSETGRKKLLKDFLNKLAGPERDQVIASLQRADEIVAGARPTAAEAVSDIPSATGLAAFQRQLELDQRIGTAPLFAAREAEQEAARMAAISGDETAIPMMQALRESRTAPIREEALAQANIAGRVVPQLEADIAARELSRIQARQLEGQMQARAAEQGVLSEQPFMPVPGLPRVSSQYRPNIDRTAEAIDAAKDAGDIAAQRLAEANFKRLQLQSLEDEGFYALKINPLVQKIDNLLATPGERSEVAIKSLNSLRDKLTARSNQNGVIDSRDLYTVRKEIADDIKKFSEETKAPTTRRLASLETNLKKAIDTEIEKAGGVQWKDYLKNYEQYSEKINRMEIGQALADKLRTTLGDTERAGSFALAVQNAASTIKRASGATRYETLGGVLSDSELKAVNAVVADLQRSAKAGKLMGKARISGMEAGETPELPRLLNTTATIGNFLVKAIKNDAADEIRKNAAELFLNPQSLAAFMQQPNSARAISAIYKKLPTDIQDFLQRVVAVQTVGQPITPME